MCFELNITHCAVCIKKKKEMYVCVYVCVIGSYDILQHKYKWWNTYGEPQRFRTWMNETFAYANEFGFYAPQQHHNTLLSFLATYDGSDLGFIGRVEYLEQHFFRLFEYNPLCRIHWHIPHNTTMTHVMKMQGAWSNNPQSWHLDPEYEFWLNLTTWDIHTHKTHQLPAYLSLTPSLFNQIVEHYWQDYVCFGYQPNYPELGLFYTGKFKKP
ncbi:hypothetical protein RFI_27053 [Reticulomyxa filosa]|uniref:Uncharacterized protein n=1 Tax=Reticulomyxa filosa TaxID=46433 RepID=X6M8K9_RETFI|nr:hypothetical protein RFI_27053 [Reticulomyxa filosa]|eukprot:ETO10323.1 hypothetical protein RFI_27053 [Reticulomyxa filosa]